jgi:membrane protease YdiL (CAAX protease family)
MDNKENRKYQRITWNLPTAIIGSVIIYFVAQIVAVVLLYLYPSIRNWDSNQANQWLQESTAAQFTFTLLFYGLIIALTTWLIRRHKASLNSIGLKHPKLIDAGYALGGLAAWFALYAAVLVVAQQMFPSLNVEQEQQLGFARDTVGLGLVLIFVSLVIMPSVAEEILMRGFMFSGLRTKLKFLPSALISSVIFGIAHLQWGSGAPLLWVAAIDTFVLGMVLAYLREKSDSLTAPIVLHMMKNSLAFIVLFIL